MWLLLLPLLLFAVPGTGAAGGGTQCTLHGALLGCPAGCRVQLLALVLLPCGGLGSRPARPPASHVEQDTLHITLL